MLLYFAPPKFAADGTSNNNNQKRIMLIVEVNNDYNFVRMINVSKINGKPNWFAYPFNVAMRDWYPLPLPSFAKINDNYIVEMFDDIDKFIYKKW